MLYVCQLPQTIQDALLTILKKHLTINDMFQYYEDESDDLLNSKVDDIDDFLTLINDMNF